MKPDGPLDWIENAQRSVEARNRRDVGVTRVGGKVGDKWLSDAAAYILAYAHAHRGGFLIENVAARWHFAQLPRAHDGRAWGAAARRAQRLGYIKRIGYAPANTSNRSPKVLWAPA